MTVMGRPGFSCVGLIFMLMLMGPNIIWMRTLPKAHVSASESRVLLAFERAGQVVVTCTALIFLGPGRCGRCGLSPRG